MKNSLLTDYIEIIKLLMEFGPQTNSQIKSFSKNLTPVVLANAIDFLLENKIITKETTRSHLSYAITERGFGILTFFKVKPSNSIVRLKP